MNRSLYEETWPIFTYGYVNEQIEDAVETQYVDWSIAESPDADYLDTMIRQITDQAYWGPTDEVARAHVAENATVCCGVSIIFMFSREHCNRKI